MGSKLGVFKELIFFVHTSGTYVCAKYATPIIDYAFHKLYNFNNIMNFICLCIVVKSEIDVVIVLFVIFGYGE